jgi:hypothetical protein
MMKKEMTNNEVNQSIEDIQIVRSVLTDKNLKCFVDCKDTFTVVSVDEETFTLKDSNDELYHFSIESVMCADGWLTAVCFESDVEFEFDLVFHDESVTDIVE